jgi:hypothetical protein
MQLKRLKSEWFGEHQGQWAAGAKQLLEAKIPAPNFG